MIYLDLLNFETFEINFIIKFDKYLNVNYTAIDKDSKITPDLSMIKKIKYKIRSERILTQTDWI
ncbi:hypothetical protein BpHYR1_007363 [Brachionus plicatilis]|uniref:Uncharacterized protein n=1 Tax=Brachionus plicatilis TaxID=10195 RepID=A0A3M7PZS0_BRAPC|nr:hypothetical protein BpHYR1_007363 [Brachionus plicatilis]